jgi:hypothetical protein
MHNSGGKNIAASDDAKTFYDETSAEADFCKAYASPGRWDANEKTAAGIKPWRFLIFFWRLALSIGKGPAS